MYLICTRDGASAPWTICHLTSCPDTVRVFAADDSYLVIGWP